MPIYEAGGSSSGGQRKETQDNLALPMITAC